MKIKFSCLFLCIIILSACSKNNEQKIEQSFITDDLGNKIVLASAPQKVVSLAPNITEMIYKLGCEKNLVGNTTFCTYPEEAKYIPKVGDMLSVDYEKLLVIKPDLIFVSVEGNRKDIYDKMIKLGFKVFVSNPRNYNGIKKTYNDVAVIFNKAETAKNEIAGWDNKLSQLQARNNENSPNKVLFLIETKPIMAAGESTFLNEYIRLLNMKNVTEGVNVNYPVLNRESVLKMNPDVIVYPADGQMTLELFKKSYPEWKNISAIKREMIVFADRDLYFRPGPRFIEALEDFYTKLHHQDE